MSSSGSYVVIHLMSSMIYYSYVPFRRRRTGIVARASHLSGTRVPLDWHARPVPGAAHTAKRPPDWMSGGRCVVLWWLALGQRSPVAQCGPQGTAQHMPPLIPQADNAGVWPEWHDGPHHCPPTRRAARRRESLRIRALTISQVNGWSATRRETRTVLAPNVTVTVPLGRYPGSEPSSVALRVMSSR